MFSEVSLYITVAYKFKINCILYFLDNFQSTALLYFCLKNSKTLFTLEFVPFFANKKKTYLEDLEDIFDLVTPHRLETIKFIFFFLQVSLKNLAASLLWLMQGTLLKLRFLNY